MEKCENISIPSVNSICTEQAYSADDCNVSVSLRCARERSVPCEIRRGDPADLEFLSIDRLGTRDLSDRTIYDFEIPTGGGARRQPDAVSSGRRPQMGARGRRQLEDSLLQGRHRETAIVRQDLVARRLDQVHHRGLILFLSSRAGRERETGESVRRIPQPGTGTAAVKLALGTMKCRSRRPAIARCCRSARNLILWILPRWPRAILPR